MKVVSTPSWDLLKARLKVRLKMIEKVLEDFKGEDIHRQTTVGKKSELKRMIKLMEEMEVK